MDENDPVDQSEFVYRRIHRNYYQANLQIAVQSLAFKPTANDTTGLSVFRAAFAQPQDTLTAVDPVKQKDYYVARLSVRELRNLRLTVVPDPDAGGPKGHAIIPELSVSAYQPNKQATKVILLDLAKLASADIVHSPS